MSINSINSNITQSSGGRNNIQREWITIMGFDIGERNFTLFTDRYPYDRLESLKSRAVPYPQRYDNNGQCNQKFSEFLEELGSCGERVFTDKFDMTTVDDKKRGKRRLITTTLLARLNNYLDKLNGEGHFDSVDYFVIEEQVKRAENNRQIQFHLRGYLIGLFLDFRPIVLFPSCYKTRILGAPKRINNEKRGKLMKMRHGDRKKWAVQKAQEILTNRGDIEGIDEIFNKKKQGKGDDCSDCLLEILAFVNLVFIDGKKDLLN